LLKLWCVCAYVLEGLERLKSNSGDLVEQG